MNLSIFVLMRMKSGHFYIRAAVLFILLLPLVSCTQKFKQVRVTSCDIVSFTPKGLRSAEAVVSLGIDNPAPSFVVRDLEMVIKDEGSRICVLTADTVAVERQSVREYKVPCAARMESLSLMEILEFAGKSDFSDFTADVTANVATGKGAGRRIEFKDIKISDLFKL